MTDGPNEDDRALPLLWLYGPGGVGKTTVGWELFTRLCQAGGPVGYVDIDQLGMCYAAPTAQNWAPEPASDRVRYRLKSRSLDAVATRFRRAGARGLIVSGIVDPMRGIDVALLPHAVVTQYRLRVARVEHLRRLAERGRPGEPVEDILRDAEALDRNAFPGVVIDTTGRNAREVAGEIAKKSSHWLTDVESPRPEAGEPYGAYGGRVDAAGEILWLCGPTGVGKSTVAWSVYAKSRRAGQHTAFLDLDQVGFFRPQSADDPGNHRLKAGNLAAVWRNFAASGAKRLVILGPLGRPEAAALYRAALPNSTITLCRMNVGREQLGERLARRADGDAPGVGIPGDELKGLTHGVLRIVTARAWAEAVALEQSGVTDISVDTDGRGAAQIADEILDKAGWLGGRFEV